MQRYNVLFYQPNKYGKILYFLIKYFFTLILRGRKFYFLPLYYILYILSYLYILYVGKFSTAARKFFHGLADFFPRYGNFSTISGLKQNIVYNSVPTISTSKALRMPFICVLTAFLSHSV